MESAIQPSFKDSSKFINGLSARNNWSKKINTEKHLIIDEFNILTNENFIKRANIILDNNENRQTTIQAIPIDDEYTTWCSDEKEAIYIFVRNGVIMKIGGTRSSMKERFGSYLCGHHVPERNKSGKMSVTNAYLYHTIEKDLLENEDVSWEIYTINIQPEYVTRNFMEETLLIKSQLYHGYESCSIKQYKELSGMNPQFSINSDPDYQKKIKALTSEELINECQCLELNPYTETVIKSGKRTGQRKAKNKSILQQLILSKNNTN